jgi:hypothetical protein
MSGSGSLYELIRLFAISIQLPTGRPGSESGSAELVHRRPEVLLTFRCDGEVHRDQYRAGIGFEF